MKSTKQIFYLCRFCGKKGIHTREIMHGSELIHTASYERIVDKNDRCYHCDSIFVDDNDWKIWKEYELTEGKKIKKDLAKLLNTDEFEELKLTFSDDYHFAEYYSKKEIYKFIKLNNRKKQLNVVLNKKTYSLKPSSSFIEGFSGVIFYILVMFLFAYFLGDYGEPHGPRFFGDSY
tara:strand:- start:71 stop:598 length:528 start_codon:yes stop_codon:yes gene_type:complete